VKRFGRDMVFSDAVLGAVTVTPDAVVVGAGRNLALLAPGDGKTITDFTVPAKGIPGNPPAHFWGAPAVADGMVFAPNMNGILYAFGG
jgi:outer membrane protein assembly factor BamB